MFNLQKILWREKQIETEKAEKRLHFVTTISAHFPVCILINKNSLVNYLPTDIPNLSDFLIVGLQNNIPRQVSALLIAKE